MSQTIILNKFKKYVAVVEARTMAKLNARLDRLKNKPDKTHKIEKLEKLIKEETIKFEYLRSVLQGHCFGFAVCHGAMDSVHKLSWWEQALVTIANWDETTKSLNNFIKIRHADKKAFWDTEKHNKNSKIKKNKIKLETLFERTLSYIVFHQTTYNFGLKQGYSQRDMLSPNNPCFEMLDATGQVRHIKERKKIVGYFTAHQFKKLLSKNDFKNKISLIRSGNHALRLYYKHGKWVVYDPNYDHTTRASIRKKFKSKEDAIQEVFRIQGQAFKVEIATIDSFKNPSFPAKTMKPSHVIKRMKELGFHMMAQLDRDEFSQQLELATKHRKGPTRIAKALVVQSHKGNNGLHLISMYHPNCFNMALDCAAQAANAYKHIANALQMQNETGTTPLHLIANFSTDSIQKVLDFAAKAPNGQQCIENALLKKDNQGWTSLEIITRRHPEFILKIIANYAPQLFETAIQVISKSKNGSHHLAKVLAEKKKTGWDVLLKNNKDLASLDKILQLSAPQNVNANTSSQNGLSYAVFMKAVGKYKLAKNKSLFFTPKNYCPSTAGMKRMLVINSAKDNTERLALATNYIKKTPKKTFAKILNEVIKNENKISLMRN